MTAPRPRDSARLSSDVVLRRSRKLVGVSAQLTRQAARRRASAFRAKAFFIGQCAIAAGVSYAVARYGFNVAVPLFAPVAAMLALGLNYGQRLARAAEVTVGVAVGALIGEAFVRLFGIGPVQVVAIVAVSMTLASLLGAGNLMITQAGVQGSVVALLAGSIGTAFGRWFEALIGALVALVFAAAVPTSTVLRSRAAAVAALENIADLLFRIAAAITAGDRSDAETILDDARATEEELTLLRGYAQDSLDLTRGAPWHRRRRAEVQVIADLLVPMDLAIRNTRVLIRRSVISLQTGEVMPARYTEWVKVLAEVTELLARTVARDEAPGLDAEHPVAIQVLALAGAAHTPDPEPALSAEVVRAQVLSILVDYLMVLGHPADRAQQWVRQVPGD